MFVSKMFIYYDMKNYGVKVFLKFFGVMVFQICFNFAILASSSCVYSSIYIYIYMFFSLLPF